MNRNRLVADGFRLMADLIEILGEEAPKAAAYRRAAHSMEGLVEDVAVLHREGRLQEIPGIGPALARKIGEIIDTGTFVALERLRARVPDGVLELTKVPGIGPRTAGVLFRCRGIAGLEDLERAARAGLLRGLPGLGEKKVQAILEGLVRLREYSRRFLLGTVLPLAERLAADLRTLPGVVDAEPAGSVRRRRETVGNLDLVVAAHDPAGIAAAIARLPGLTSAHDYTPVPGAAGALGAIVSEAPEETGTVVFSLALPGGLQARVAVVAPREWASALVWWTGSIAHNRRLDDLARERGLQFTPRGFFPAGVPNGQATGPVCTPESESELYHFLGLDWVPPELREDTGEIEAAAGGRLPRLIELGDIRGDLHVHTRWSDGLDDIAAMAAAARERGYAYIAVSDHSRSLAVARGLTVERLSEQRRAINALNEQLAADGGPPFRVLHGAEVDILPDGGLDYPAEVLAGLDVVIASVHSRFRMDREAMTRRIITAMRNPHVNVIGHLTGRLIDRRPPYDLDTEAVLAAARETGTALELNASPDRLDVTAEVARLAAHAGIRIVINTDAHSTASLADMELGVAAARRAWLTRECVLNALPLDGLLQTLARTRGR